MALIIFTMLCNHNDSLFLKHFHHPQQNLYLLSNNTQSLPLGPRYLYSFFCLYEFAYARYFI